MSQSSRASAARTLFAQAMALRDGGRLAEAEGMCRHILEFDPAHADTLNLLGTIGLHTGHAAEAIPLLRLAVSVKPRDWAMRLNLGHALKATGQTRDAIAAYREAVRLCPDAPEALFALGSTLLGDGDAAAAEPLLRDAARRAPNNPNTHNNLGLALRALGRPNDAEVPFRRAIELAPDHAGPRINLALALGEQNRTTETIAALREAVRLAPDNADMRHALGTLLVREAAFEEAIPHLRRVRALLPNVPDPYAGLVWALTHTGEFAEAEEVGRATVRLAPDDAGAHSNLASVLMSLGRLAEAEAEVETALRLDPELPLARTGRAFIRLLDGRLPQAWDDLEYRHAAARMEAGRHAPLALFVPDPTQGAAWNGQARDGETLLVYSEQGLGDTIQMLRYAPLLADHGPVVWIVPGALRELAAGVDRRVNFIGPGDLVPAFDLHCSVMSLPRAFRTSLATIPGGAPYVHADPARVALWRERLSSLTGKRIGLAWRGNPDYPLDRLRSLPEALLRSLADVPGVRFVSLQLPRPETPPFPGLFDPTEQIADFSDTAALMASLDLVISVDTSIAHLAGALGLPVWLLNRFNSDWRWLLDRTDSVWYPSMRIFRQPTPGDWDGVIAAVRAALEFGTE